jgi:hypothetical protein
VRAQHIDRRDIAVNNKSAGSLSNSDLGKTITVTDGETPPWQVIQGVVQAIHHVIRPPVINDEGSFPFQVEGAHPEVEVEVEVLATQVVVVIPTDRRVEVEQLAPE